MRNVKFNGRLAGMSYLLIIVCGIFSHLIVRASVVDFGDAVKTSQNILENSSMFRLSTLSDFIMVLSFLMAGILLYSLLKSTNIVVARIMLALNIVGTSMMAVNMLNQQAAIMILENNTLLSVFDANQVQSLSLFFMRLHSYGYKFATISFGVWLLPMGYLIVKSGLVPKIIGYLLIVGSVTYIISFVSTILGVSVSSDITIPADLGEFSLCLYLLIVGVSKNYSGLIQQEQ